MIALLFASRAFAQDPAEPVPVEPPPVEPSTEPETPEVLPPVDVPPPEPVWEEVAADPATEPVQVIAPETTPWVAVPDDPRVGFLRFAISAELGSLGNDDPAYDLFSDGDAMGSGGVAVGVKLARNLGIVGSWHHFRHGATVSVVQTETDADFDSNAREFRAAWLAHEGAAGLKVDGGIRDVLFPYIAAQGLLLGARMRLDDDPSERDNPGQVQAGGLTWGAMGTAGVELRIPPDASVQAAWTLEFGHAWLATADFGEFGSMQPGGFVARSGLGLRF